MQRSSFLAIAAVLALSACGDQGLPPAQNYATIAGRVYDVDSNAPVVGATVTGSVVLTATSADDGTYRIAHFPIGPNELQVTPPPGYSAVQAQYNISPQQGETLTVNIPLKKSS